MSHSSATAEKLATTKNTAVPQYLRILLEKIFYKRPPELTTNSKIAFELATSIREPAESLNKFALAATREDSTLIVTRRLGGATDSTTLPTDYPKLIETCPNVELLSY